MSFTPAPDSGASSGMLGAIRSWLQGRPGNAWPPAEVLLDPSWAPKPHVHGSIRVLVVDDNPANLMVMSAQLASRGLVPSLAADGAQAVAIACERHFDLILMDLQMPVLDGLDATSAIRRFEALHSRPAVPVVAYSGMCLGAGVLAAKGLNGSLAKPCEDQDLEDCLVRWCPAYRPAEAECDAGHGAHWRQPTVTSSPRSAQG